jgi:hypothetical protein
MPPEEEFARSHSCQIKFRKECHLRAYGWELVADELPAAMWRSAWPAIASPVIWCGAVGDG